MDFEPQIIWVYQFYIYIYKNKCRHTWNLAYQLWPCTLISNIVIIIIIIIIIILLAGDTPAPNDALATVVIGF